jgi:hypothetical protein
MDAHRSALMREILAEMDRRIRQRDRIRGYRRRGDQVVIALTADGEVLAADLEARYGDAVQLRVGNFAFPFTRPSEFSRDLAPEATVAIDGLVLDAMLDDAVVPSGRSTRGRVRFENRGTARIAIGTGDPLGGYVVLRGTSEIVGGRGRAARGVAMAVTLSPGDTRELAFLLSTASTDPTFGYRLPPGHYDVVVPIPLYQSLPDPGEDDRLLSPPVLLELT